MLQRCLPLLGLAALAPVLLGACGAPHLQTVRTAKDRLVGQDAAILSQCIGEPMTVRAAGNGAGPSAYVYSSAQARGADGLLQAVPPPEPDRNARACVFDIVVQDGRILAVRSDNRAGWGFGSIKNCSAVVERCVQTQSAWTGQ